LNLKLGAFAYSYDVKGNIIAANENAATPRARAYTLDAIADGGADNVGNIEPLARDEHIRRHSAKGDFARWARWARSRR
jgi:hypothetical protein